MEALDQWSSPGFDGFDLSELASAGAAGAFTGAIGTQTALRTFASGLINSLDAYYRAECRTAFANDPRNVTGEFLRVGAGAFLDRGLAAGVNHLPVGRYLNRNLSRFRETPQYVAGGFRHSAEFFGGMEDALGSYLGVQRMLLSELGEALVF